ncbi:MAG: hypothetical protein HY392_03170 [Candidatus Diapherotrites archaeon]|nr:hypothetical protein [Candidatus Diapherotrites archaeon]
MKGWKTQIVRVGRSGTAFYFIADLQEKKAVLCFGANFHITAAEKALEKLQGMLSEKAPPVSMDLGIDFTEMVANPRFMKFDGDLVEATKGRGGRISIRFRREIKGNPSKAAKGLKVLLSAAKNITGSNAIVEVGINPGLKTVKLRQASRQMHRETPMGFFKNLRETSRRGKRK